MSSNAHLNLKIGNTRCRCSGCGEYFNSVAAFDKHRTGQGRARRCLFAWEMSDHGMIQNSAGYWCSSASDFEWRAVS